MLKFGCMLKIGVIGLNHEVADLAFREAIAKGAEVLAGPNAIFFAHPTILLSTCNRMEIYFSGDDLAEVHSDLLQRLRNQIPEAFEHRLYSYFGLDCFSHLVKVTAGLDSAIVAETEIQRQVKIAYGKAAAICELPSCMHFVFQKALKLSKFIRSRLEIDRGAPHLFRAIWTLAEGVQKGRILLVGHSELNRKLAHYLFQRGVQMFSLATQNPSAVCVPGAVACGREELLHWHKYDLIVCATASRQYLLSGQGRLGQVIFDLSVPRNVDPEIERVKLYNIEQLNQWIRERRDLQFSKVEESLEVIRQETLRMAKCYKEKMGVKHVLYNSRALSAR